MFGLEEHAQSPHGLKGECVYSKMAKSHLPVFLTHYPPDGLTRAQFAEKYLRTLINDKYTVASYSKSRPNVVGQTGYFWQTRHTLGVCHHDYSCHCESNSFDIIKTKRKVSARRRK
jgi:hypothetical protein